MTPPVPPYSGIAAKCPKCRSTLVGTTHHPTRVGKFEGTTKQRTPWGCTVTDTFDEHLCRDCGNCGYSWPEALAADDTLKDAPLKALPGGKE